MSLEEIEDPWLKENWVYTDDELKNGGTSPSSELHIQSRGSNISGSWETQGLQGFTKIDKVRYYYYKIMAKSNKDIIRIIAIYSYIGPSKDRKYSKDRK